MSVSTCVTDSRRGRADIVFSSFDAGQDRVELGDVGRTAKPRGAGESRGSVEHALRLHELLGTERDGCELLQGGDPIHQQVGFVVIALGSFEQGTRPIEIPFVLRDDSLQVQRLTPRERRFGLGSHSRWSSESCSPVQRSLW